MTALCGGGASAPKLGYADAVVLGATAIGEYLARKLPRPVASTLGALLAGTAYNATAFCATDPPPDPGLAPNDYFLAIGGGSTAEQIVALKKFEDWFGHQYWWELCDCTTVATPTPPVPSDPGPALVNPALPTGSTAMPCWNVNIARHDLHGLSPVLDLTTIALPATTRVPVSSAVSGGPTTGSAIPPGTTQLTYSGTAPAFTGGTTSAAVLGEFFNSAGASIGGWTILAWNNNGATQLPTNLLVPGTASSWAIFFQGATTVGVSYNFQIRFNCAGVPNDQLQTPCCPPDPLVDIRLKTIIDLLIQITQQSGPSPPPAGYVKGTVHTGLTGEVSLPVSGIIGVLVQVTAGVPARIVIGGNPPYQWDLGFLSILTSDGMIEQRRLTREHQLWFPAQGEFATVVGVFLNAGVTITLTELKAA